MIDLSAIPDAVKIAKGEYSIVRARHEDEMKQLQILTGKLSSFSSAVLKQLQTKPIKYDPAGFAEGVRIMREVRRCARRVEALAEQREQLRKQAWP